MIPKRIDSSPLNVGLLPNSLAIGDEIAACRVTAATDGDRWVGNASPVRFQRCRLLDRQVIRHIQSKIPQNGAL